MSCSCVFPRARLHLGSNMAHSLALYLRGKRDLKLKPQGLTMQQNFTLEQEMLSRRVSQPRAHGSPHPTLMIQWKKAWERCTKTPELTKVVFLQATCLSFRPELYAHLHRNCPYNSLPLLYLGENTWRKWPNMTQEIKVVRVKISKKEKSLW